nr:peptide ABC transporter substrate-binding protein [Clostridia bacterium]
EGYDDGEISVTTVGDGVLEFVLSAPCAYMEDLMAFPSFFPVKRDAVEGASGPDGYPGAWCSEAGFVSNGAFICESWEHDDTITYVKNPYYYDADSVRVEKLVYVLSEDIETTGAAFLSGELDFLDDYYHETAVKAEADGTGTEVIYTTLGTYYLSVNARSALFDGMTPAQAACAREAISILIDRAAICDMLGLPEEAVADGFIPDSMSDGSCGFFENSHFDPYAISADHEKTLMRARQLLIASGLELGKDGRLAQPVTLTYLFNDSPYHGMIAGSVAESLAEIGIVVETGSLSWNEFQDARTAGGFDIVRGGWIADFNDPINMLEMFTSYSGNNDCFLGMAMS